MPKKLMASDPPLESTDPGLSIGERLFFTLRALRSFGISAKVGGELVEHAEVLLVVETARLFTWGYALGVIDTTAKPLLPADVTPFNRQLSIHKILGSLHVLVVDDYLLQKAYGCSPLLSGEKTSITPALAPGVKSAGIALARAFDNFSVPPSESRYPDRMWAITDGEKFAMFVAEVGTLVSKLRKITAHLVPYAALDAMIYTRIWKITSSSAAHTIADACEEEYIEISSQASDRAVVMSISSEEAISNVINFINFDPILCHCEPIDNGDHEDGHQNENKNDDKENRLRQLETRMMMLERHLGHTTAPSHAMQVMPGPPAFTANGPSRPEPRSFDEKNRKARPGGGEPSSQVLVKAKAAVNYGINIVPKAAADPPGPFPCNVMRSGPNPAEVMPPPSKWKPHGGNTNNARVHPPPAPPEMYTPSTSSSGGGSGADDADPFKDHHHPHHHHHNKRDRQPWVDVPSDSELSDSDIVDVAPGGKDKARTSKDSAEPDRVKKERRLRNAHSAAAAAGGPQANSIPDGKSRHDAGAKAPDAAAVLM